jgi:hypothetical protein
MDVGIVLSTLQDHLGGPLHDAKHLASKQMYGPHGLIVGECKLHLDIVATARVALPIGVEPGNCKNKDSHTMLNSLCSEGQVTLPRQNSDHRLNM